MAIERRRELIRQLEELRGSRVLTYITGDRDAMGAQIGDDALRPLYDQLRHQGAADLRDVVLYSRGGALDVPWRIASALREFSGEWNALIPFRANSAATLLALGADHVVLGRHGELGPIDPIMNIERFLTQPGESQGTAVKETINVEDVMGYLRFVQERVGLTDQEMLSASLNSLIERLDAIGLGSAYRTHSHIRDVARRMLQSRSDPPNERTMETIVETLAERVYAHGHAIGFGEAHDIGLPVVKADDQLERCLWDLLEEYESDLKLREPLDPQALVGAGDGYSEDVVIAVIDSADLTFEFRGVFEIRARRQMPPNLNVALNLNLQLPTPPQGEIAPAIQQMLQGLQEEILKEAQRAVQEALKHQAPVAGIEGGFRGGSWQRAD